MSHKAFSNNTEVHDVPEIKTRVVQMILLVAAILAFFGILFALVALQPGQVDATPPGTRPLPPDHTGTLIGVVDKGPIVVNVVRGSGAEGSKGWARSYVRSPFPSRASVVVTFDILFHDNFEWSCRGKVGGVYVGTGSASGGNYSTDGASHRLMWDKNGGAFSYVYVPKGTQARQPAPLNEVWTMGVGVFEGEYNGALVANTWHRVGLGVKLNTVGKSDGALMLSIDGKKRVLSGVLWRLSNLDIRLFKLNVFHGGGCIATRDSALTVRNIELRAWE